MNDALTAVQVARRAEQSRKGPKPMPPPADEASALETGLMIVAWYATSVVATTTSKQLPLDAYALTLCQHAVATACSLVVLRALRLRPYRAVGSLAELRLTALLALAFFLGFVTFNAALGAMHVSLAMVLRATEPVFTLALSALAFGVDGFWRRLASLGPVVAGAGLSALGATDGSARGVLLCFASNGCFAARGVVTKQLKRRHGVDDYSLFLHINGLGFFFALLASAAAAAARGPPDLGGVGRVLLLANGVSFWAYLQLSWLVLARVSAVTHSVCNAMRRPVVILGDWLQFGNYISSTNAFGIALASGGALVYARVARALDAERPEEPAEPRWGSGSTV
mmetsp:Transcript_8957/g.26875  ORF Transcript_8957/g.26875 Transcript_8957/m.26875 type:complete len:340 (+) Transcript_8957:116-1135(+)